ncbi:MAG: PcfB family protein [Eubacterium sp.]|nr:PcfB family protein [Eubacterium sp.]
MSEMGDVVQIIRVEYEGVELVMKLGSASIHAVQKAISFIVNLLDYEKNKGKTSLRKLLMRGGDLHVAQFDEEDLKEMEKLCKKYGVLYSLVPKLNKNSTRREILFHNEAVPRMDRLTKKMSHPERIRLSTMDKFLDETDDKTLNAFGDFVKEESKSDPKSHAGVGIENLLTKVGDYAMKKKNTSVDEMKKELEIPDESAKQALEKLSKIGVITMPDESGRFSTLMEPEDYEKKIKRLTELSQRMRRVAAEKDTQLMDITIAKKMVESETLEAIMTRIPGTWGEEARYIWVDKHDAMEIHDGKTILTYLDKNKSYDLFDKGNNKVGTIRGQELFRNHYSSVDKSVRKKYEKVIQTPTLDRKAR